jgi:hypothetical protein
MRGTAGSIDDHSIWPQIPAVTRSQSQIDVAPGSLPGRAVRRSGALRLLVLVMAMAPAARLPAAQTYAVGPTRPYPTLASLPALSPGDLVEIDPGTYQEVKRWTRPGTAANPIVIRGVGAPRPVFDATGKTVDGVLPNPRAVFQVEADYITLENLEFRNARNGDNGAGLRVTGGNHVTARSCRITACDMGVMSDRNVDLRLESSEIASNGTALYDGYSHNLYLGGDSATIRYCSIHDSLYGQNFKTRGHYTELLYNYIADSQDGEVGLVDAAETAATNSHAVVIGNVIVSKPRLSGYNSGRFIQFGQDSGGQHNGTLYAFNNTFIAGDGRIQFLSANATGATVVARDNIFYGSDKIVGTLGGGISGDHNWLPSTAAVPGTFTASTRGTDPGFVDRAARDFHLAADSPCRDQGVNTLSFLDGAGQSHPGLPTQEYVDPLQARTRPADAQVDLGAYEFAVSAPRINSAARRGSDFVIVYSAAVGATCELERTSDLPAASWPAAMLTNVVGAGGTVEVTDPQAMNELRRFYRVRLATMLAR